MRAAGIEADIGRSGTARWPIVGPMDRTLWLRALIVVAIAAAAPSAHADTVYKCIGAGGKITYSQNPCYGENWQRFDARSPSPRKPQPANKKTAPAAEADKGVRKASSEKSATGS